MGSILQFSARRPLLLIPALLLLTLLAALQLPQLRVSISAQGILQQNSPARELLRQTEQQFGRDDISIIYLGDPDLFSPDRLELIRSTVERIDALPFVDRSSSLFSVPQVQNRDNSLFSGPYFATRPTAPAQMEHIKREALDNPLANGSLIGRRDIQPQHRSA